MLSIDGLTKIYSKKIGPAIKDVSFEVRDGEVVGFVGLNGAGKTTTIRIAAGVALPSGGRVSIDGLDIVRQKVEASRRIGWVPELPNFEQNAKAIDLMMYYAGYYGIHGEEARQASLRLLKETGLEGVERRKASSYSQGMKKRFVLAAAMLSNPQNYLFDEILNGLDPEGIHYFRNLIVKLRQEKKAVLLSSHILSEVEGLSDRVAFIHKGRLLKVMTRNELSSLEGGVLVLRLNVVDDRLLDYLGTLGKPSVDNDKVTVSGYTGDPSAVNLEVIRMGYSVKEISYHTPSLEEYFLKLIGEAQ
ncbi:MAG: ABC transporter ATP-binding protein [Nitrososphaerota archaeon]|nr:ABC transporter ATP-binding protein [Nitrososphaerota archaeon]